MFLNFTVRTNGSKRFDYRDEGISKQKQNTYFGNKFDERKSGCSLFSLEYKHPFG